MGRSSKKGPFVDTKLLKKISKLKPGDSAPIKTWSRDSEISPEMVGYKFSIHNGKIFMDISVTEEMIGHRLGEFAPTRKFIRHGGKMQRDIEQGTPGAAPAGVPATPAPQKPGGK